MMTMRTSNVVKTPLQQGGLATIPLKR